MLVLWLEVSGQMISQPRGMLLSKDSVANFAIRIEGT